MAGRKPPNVFRLQSDPGQEFVSGLQGRDHPDPAAPGPQRVHNHLDFLHFQTGVLLPQTVQFPPDHHAAWTKGEFVECYRGWPGRLSSGAVMVT